MQAPDPVPGYQPQLGPVLQEDVTRRLLGVDPDTVIRNDGAAITNYKYYILSILKIETICWITHAPGCWWHLEFLRGKLEHSSEGSPIRNGEHFERQLRVRGQGDLECHFGASCSHLLWLCFVDLQIQGNSFSFQNNFKSMFAQLQFNCDTDLKH